jgi:hypothetical protein
MSLNLKDELRPVATSHQEVHQWLGGFIAALRVMGDHDNEIGPLLRARVAIEQRALLLDTLKGADLALSEHGGQHAEVRNLIRNTLETVRG